MTTAQKTLDLRGGPLERIMRKTKKDTSKVAEKLEDEILHDCDVGTNRARDLLRVCRPLSVYLVRLPESLVNKNVEATKKLPVKKKRNFWWKNGRIHKKRSKNQKSEKEARTSLQTQESETPEHESCSSKLVTGDGTSLERTESRTGEPFPADVEETLVKKIQAEKIAESVEELSSPLAHKISDRVDAAPLSLDSFTNSEETERPEKRQFPINELTIEAEHRTLETKEHTDNGISLAEESNNENRTVLQPPEENESWPTAKNTRKRRNSSLSEKSGSQQVLQHSKKPRCLLPTSDSSASPLEERHATVAKEIAITSSQQPVLLTNVKASKTTSKPRVIGKKIHPMHEVVVVVNRLDNSRSPLVEKWKNRVDLSQLDEVTPNLRETLSISTSSINQIEKENEKEFQPTINGNESAGITSLPSAPVDPPSFDIYGNNDIVMCDSNEEGSEEDDDEIIEFLAARRRTKSSNKKACYGNQTDQEMDKRQELSPSSIKTPPPNRSGSNANRTRGRSRQRKQSGCTTDDSKSEVSFPSVRSRRFQSKTPALPKTRKTTRQSYLKYDDSSSEESRSPPITRSRSRAPIHHLFYDDSTNSDDVFHQKRKQKRWRRISCSDSSDEAEEPHEEINENESRAPVGNAENICSVVESENTEKNDELRDSAAVNDPHDDPVNSNDVVHRDRKKNFCHRMSYIDSPDEADETSQAVVCNRENVHAAIRSDENNEKNVDYIDVMNSNDVLAEKNKQKIRHRRSFSHSFVEVDQINEEINDNESQAVVDDSENLDNDVESEETEDPLNSAATTDSNLTLMDNLQFKRDNDIENCMARKKLATMKDAMVVLTRLEDLNNQCSDGGIGFGGTSDFDFSSHFGLENSSVNQSSTLGEFSDKNLLQSASESQNREGDGINRRSKQINQDHKRARDSEENVKLGRGTTSTRNDGEGDELSESDDEGQLTVDESIPTELAETDGELRLIVDERHKTTTDPMIPSPTDGVLTGTVSSNSKAKSSPAPKTPSKELVEASKLRNCTKQQAEKGNHKCQNISPSTRCVTCDRSFKSIAALEEHTLSSAFCSSGFQCNFCSCIFKTLIELSKHHSRCIEKRAKRLEKTAAHECQTSAVKDSEASRSKGKKQKPVITKNPPKKIRKGPRCRSDNLSCNVCSTTFDTKTDLSEHLYKHSSEELQEAFRAAKAEAMAKSQAEQAAKLKGVASNMSNVENAHNQVSNDTTITSTNDNYFIQNVGALETEAIVSNVNAIASNTLNNDLSTSRPANVCLCHRDLDRTSVDKTDLQIEMVLLCKYCHVIFRRRECLEVHYRMSSICSVNRTRERCPSLFCANCQSTLNSWADMRQHLELHAHQNSERTIRFVCNICRVVFVGFGALFYNHWTSHSKDTMFVAGRYNFPKFSVQPINGTEKLPAGARSDEDYIFVAEHVCATCREPFSTRRDLEKHQQSASCSKQISTQSKNAANNRQNERPKKAHPTVGVNVSHATTPKRIAISPRNNSKPLSPTVSAGQQHNLIKTRMFCDVCNLAFINEHWLTTHSKNMHENHFTFVPTTLSGTPLALPFKCNKCSAFAGSVSAIEEHWRTDVLHQGPAALLKMKKTPQPSKPEVVTSSRDQGKNVQENPSSNASMINVNDVTSTDKSKDLKKPPIITIDDPESNSDSRASEDTPTNQNTTTRNGESVISVPSITSTESIQVPSINEAPVLPDVPNNPSLFASNSNEKQRAKKRALEDPSVDVRLSETSGTKLSASLVIGDTVEKRKDNTVNGNTESYKILLSNQSSPGNIKMILSKTSSKDLAADPGTKSAEKDKVAQAEGSHLTAAAVSDVAATLLLLAGTPIGDKDTVAQTKGSNPTVPVESCGDPTQVPSTGSTVAGNNEIVQTKTSESIVPSESDKEATLQPSTELTVEKNNEVAPTEGTDLKSNDEPTNVPTPKKPANTAIVPEVIDIFDEAEDCENEQPTGQAILDPQSRNNLFIDAHETVNSLLESAKSNVVEMRTDATPIKIDTPKSLPVDAQKTSGSCSGTESSSNPTGAKSGSPGRSKMMKAALKLSSISFEEDRWNWLRSSSANRDVANSMAPLIPKKQGFLRVKDLSELQAVRNYTCDDCKSTFESEKSLGEHRRTATCGGSTQGRNVQYPRGISAALVLPDPSERPKTPEANLPPPLAPLSNDTTSSLRRALSSQQPSCPQQVISNAATAQTIQAANYLPNMPVNNTTPPSWTSIGNTSVLGNSPNQFLDPQLFQQHQSTLSGGSMLMQNLNQGLPEIRTSTLGYHTLPLAVGLPSVQTNSHQPMATPHPISSNNPLPKFTGRHAPIVIQQPDKTNKYLCTICHTFECSSLDAIRDHLKKHYNGWKNSTSTQDSRQPSPVASKVPAPSPDTYPLSSLEMTANNRQISSKNVPVAIDSAANRPLLGNWTIKNTPQGPVLVTPVSTESNNNRAVLRQASFNSNNLSSNALYSSQLVFRCRICKSAVYKSYPPLRNHAILVHGITDYNLLAQRNIAQNAYLCTQCPNTSALFDSEEEFREHVDNIHTHSCPSCRRVFSNFLTLRHHLEQCRVSTSSNRNTYGNNC